MKTRRVTIVDVASASGVSIASVSAAVRGGPGVSSQTRERITAVAKEMGWSPSIRGRSLVAQRAFAVALVIQRSARVVQNDPFFAGFIAGAESVLFDRGYALVLQVSDSREATLDRYRRLAKEHRIDGVMLTDIEVADTRFPLLQQIGTPAVAVNSAPACPFVSVRQDHSPGFVDLLNTVIGLGHRRIAHVTGQDGLIHSRLREDLWRATLQANRIRPGRRIAGDFTVESGQRAADTLLRGRGPHPTAVVCGNDLMAIGFMARAAALNVRVPEDVSVTGFDGLQFGAYTHPALTTVQTAPDTLGEQAALTLVDLLEGGSPEDVEIEPTVLVRRGSLGQALP